MRGRVTKKTGSGKPGRQPRHAGAGTTVAELCAAMEAIAPTTAAADWDNVGLLVGSRTWSAMRLLLTIDTTTAVLDEADKGRFDAIVSYHPVLFKAAKRMVIDPRSQEGVAADCLARKIAVYSPHTALDAAPAGTNDTLAELAGLTDLEPISGSPMTTAQCKLVIFVPETHVEKVADAVFAAGAGRIGAYEQCSFRLMGEGTFFGTEYTDPVVGRKGRLERVEELRIETVMPSDAPTMRRVTQAIRASHPYEEPAFEFYPLSGVPRLQTGQGRLGTFKPRVTLGQLARSLSRATRASCPAIVGDTKMQLSRGVVIAGAGGDIPFSVPGGLMPGDVVITGEMRHHDALRVARCGAAAVLLGHWASERPVLKSLAQAIQSHLPRCKIELSRADADPIYPL